MNEITLWGSLSQEMTAIITDPIYLWDLIGTFVFGISGVLLGLERRMDVFGMFILAVLVERWVSIVFTVNLPGKVLSKGAYIEWPKGNVSGDQLKTILGQVNDKLSFDKIQVDTLQKQLDSLIPGLMGLLLTFACMWLLKKKVSPITIIIGLFVVGIVASFFGIM